MYLIKSLIIFISVLIMSYSCTKISASSQGEVQIVMTGNVHGQLDPCG